MRNFILLIGLFYSVHVFCYELVVVQAVSESKQTFITRQGKKDGMFEGKKGTFTSHDVSVIAKAIMVNHEFTQWELSSDYTDIPFNKGEIITYYDAQEYLWALTPSDVRKKYIKTEIYRPRHNVSAHTAFVQGLNETVASSDTEAIRGGYQVELFYERELNYQLSLAGGIRLSRESINLEAGSLTNDRFLGIAELRYYFDPIKMWNNTRVGLAFLLGYGQSQTASEGAVSSGYARLLPGTKLHINIPMSDKNHFILESAFETISTTESYASGVKQDSTVNNIRIGMGIRHYF